MQAKKQQPKIGDLPPFDADKLSRKEAADLLGMEENSLSARHSRGETAPPRYRIGRHVFYRRSETLAFIETCRVAA